MTGALAVGVALQNPRRNKAKSPTAPCGEAEAGDKPSMPTRDSNDDAGRGMGCGCRSGRVAGVGRPVGDPNPRPVWRCSARPVPAPGAMFINCMTVLPGGATKSKYDDWDKVVRACDDVAYKQSFRREGFIKGECRS